DGAALFDFVKDALVNQVIELRHDCEGGDVALLQRLHQFGGVEGFEIEDARSLHEGKQHVRHQGEDVKQRKDAEQGIIRSDVDPVENGVNFAQQISMREHHAFGIG